MKKLIYLLIAAIIVFSGCKKNIEPVCQFISPQDGAEVYSNIPLSLLINAFDEDGSVSEVRFFIDEVIQKTFTTPPYSAFIESELLTPGTHKLTAYAIDNEGARGETSISITVIDISEGIQCSFVKPTDGDTYDAGEEIPIEINATSTNGDILSVTLYINDTPETILVSAPYKHTIERGKLTAGTHKIKAVVFNSIGASKEVTISITITEETESPNFVTFKDGFIPSSWKLSSSQDWRIDNAFGYDDLFSLNTITKGATVATTKTFDQSGYIQFYTKSWQFTFYVDGKPISNNDLQPLELDAWTRWAYVVPAGTHIFRWEATAGSFSTPNLYLDAISFSKMSVPKVNMESLYPSDSEYETKAIGRVTKLFYDEIISVGFCWSENPNPTIDDNFIEGYYYSYYDNLISKNIPNLEGGKSLYFRAYAENSAGIGYSEDKLLVVPFRLGQEYGGGVIIYIDSNGEHGKIAAKENISTGMKWYNGTYITTDATDNWNGYENTQKIIEAQGAGIYAAKICEESYLEGYHDWYLPGPNEFKYLTDCMNNDLIFNLLGVTQGDIFWTSQETSKTAAYSYIITNGYYGYDYDMIKEDKSKSFKVRPFRKF